jgi:hypothetical protein
LTSFQDEPTTGGVMMVWVWIAGCEFFALVVGGVCWLLCVRQRDEAYGRNERLEDALYEMRGFLETAHDAMDSMRRPPVSPSWLVAVGWIIEKGGDE